MFLAMMGRGAYKIFKIPFKITSGIVFSLEKVLKIIYLDFLNVFFYLDK